LWAAVEEVDSGKTPIGLAFFFTLAFFFVLTLFFVLGRIVEPDLLETNDVYCRKEDLETPVNKLYDMMDIN